MSKLTVHGAKAASAATAKSDIVVVPLFKNEDLSTSASEVNAAAGDVLQRAITLGDADAKLGKITTMVGSGNIARIMSVGCGDRSSFNLEAQLSVTGAVSRALASSKARMRLSLEIQLLTTRCTLSISRILRSRHGDGLLPLHGNLGYAKAGTHVF